MSVEGSVLFQGGIVGSFIDFGLPVSGFFLAYQLWQRRKQFTTEFEDKLTDEYRDIVYELPVSELAPEKTNNDESKPLQRTGRWKDDENEGDLKDYHRYFDHTNQQIFLRINGRVSKSTWEDWSEGIETHMKNPNFRCAWTEIRERDNTTFTELNKLCPSGESPENWGLDQDPRRWEQEFRWKAEKFWYATWTNNTHAKLLCLAVAGSYSLLIGLLHMMGLLL